MKMKYLSSILVLLLLLLAIGLGGYAQSQNIKVRNQVTGLQKQVVTLETQNENLSAEIKDLKSQIETLRKECSKEFDDLAEEIDNLEDYLKTQNENLSVDIKDLKSEIETLKREFGNLTEKLDNLEDCLKTQNENLSVDIKDLKSENKNLLLEINGLKSQIEVLTERFDNLKDYLPFLNISEMQATVVRVIDGDTIEVDIVGLRYKVRYIGIDTPELDDERDEYRILAEEATKYNRELVEGKTVRLEKDVSGTDRYGRLLRYVYVGDVFVNAELVRQGLAWAKAYPPDTKYQDTLEKAEAEARQDKIGLWAIPTPPSPSGEIQEGEVDKQSEL